MTEPTPTAVQAEAEQKALWTKIKEIHHSGDAWLAALDRDTVRDATTGRITQSPIGADYDPKLAPDKQTKVFFTRERIFSPFESAKSGHPTHIIKTFITVIPPRYHANGKPATKDYKTIHTEVTPFYEWRFPNEWKAFCDGRQALASTVTPLSQWPELEGRVDVIEELRGIQITTVEDLVGTGDAAGGTYIKDFVKWKDKARAFLANKNKPTAVAAVEDKLAEQQKAHEAQINALMERLAQLEATQGKKSKPHIAEPYLPD